MTGTSKGQSPPSPKAKESDSQQPSYSLPKSSGEDTKKWGTHVMGPPAVPTVHPDNQKAAMWKGDHQQIYHQPYLQFAPVEKPRNNPFEPVIHTFNSWSRKAEIIARNIWHNLKMGHSVSETACGKVNLRAKAMTRGGFESLYKQTFATDPNERLKKTFACYLSTSTGHVAGTLYLSTARLAFCSDRPLSFTAPSGQGAWSYYKVVIPLGNIGTVNPVTMRENPSEKYIQIHTIDGHDFWFTGFVNFEKATQHLLSIVSEFRAHA
ncbi:hypothetical protein VitviT2T_001594 [Vitis vinifera]|uniref:GRAM domain-containing protein n=2 Tax=Vitis vinifera TaxID=29760 RepID=A0ABY9BG35_VITVI|nr:GEM-like protein 5 [Vitis vinifera]WJZ81773.1 hypothetical protein VitviT2T_001594 [Vitis vinifera]|eukprot:XP_002263369.1 PREDICTED: GEM-like protein 5 isoform X2 [Vitis vinifera]